MSLLRRRMMMQQQQEDVEYVTSIDGERIKILQVIPKKHDPKGRSIHDEVYEENGKRYLKKQVFEDVTGIINTQPLNLTLVPKVSRRLKTTTNYNPEIGESNLLRYYENCCLWIDCVETVGWSGGQFGLDGHILGIKTYVSGAFRLHNPNALPTEESTELLSNKPFRYAVPEEEIEIIEIL